MSAFTEAYEGKWVPSERDRLRGVIGGVLCNAFYFPKKVTAHILGQDMGPLIERTVDSLLAGGFGDIATAERDWADYFESFDSTVGAPTLTPALVASLLRGPRPWGTMAGVDA